MNMNLRAADADRDRVVAELGQHAAAGRLTLDEFDTRAQAAYAARTMADLAALTVDLPHTELRPTTRRRTRTPAALYTLAAIVLTVTLLGVLGAAATPAIANGMNSMMSNMPGMMGAAGGCH